MITRQEVLEYGLNFEDVYIDTPFHDDNWILLRCKRNKKAFAWTYEKDNHIWVNVKVNPEWRDVWRATYTAVIPDEEIKTFISSRIFFIILLQIIEKWN